MTGRQKKKWLWASHLAFVAMGQNERQGYGRGRHDPQYKWRADEDPLAHFLLTDLIFNGYQAKDTTS